VRTDLVRALSSGILGAASLFSTARGSDLTEGRGRGELARFAKMRVVSEVLQTKKLARRLAAENKNAGNFLALMGQRAMLYRNYYTPGVKREPHS
jgi:hypothetical protein